MEDEDDMFVVIIGDEDDRNDAANAEEATDIPVKIEPGSEAEVLDVDDILKSAVEHGIVLETHDSTELEVGDIKVEPLDSDYEYLDTTDNDDSDEFEEKKKKTKTNLSGEKKRGKMLPASLHNSYVKELRNTFPDLKKNKALLVQTLAEVMRNTTPPEPPQDFYIVNSIMFECVVCNNLSDTLPGAKRHYQEKHGPRYLKCLACGVDFRSKTNLYKHEKRCNARDAAIVLRARAIFVGRKGKSRPFLPSLEEIEKERIKNAAMKATEKKTPFSCSLCSATFVTPRGLESHLNSHAGIRPHCCSYCPAAYTSRTALNRHAALHRGLKFICDHCKRPFSAKAALIAHLNTHVPLRKFGCSLCGRRYSQRAALLLHHGKHAQLPLPFACKLCPKRYPRMFALKKHMERVHGMLMMTRKMFFKKLPMMSELQLESAKVVLKTEMNNGYTLKQLDAIEKEPSSKTIEIEVTNNEIPEVPVLPEAGNKPQNIEEGPTDIPIQIQASEEITLEENQLVELVKYLQNYHNTGDDNGKVMCVNDGQLLEVSYKDTDENGYKQVEVRPVFSQVQVSVTSTKTYDIEPEEIIVSRITNRKSMPEI